LLLVETARQRIFYKAHSRGELVCRDEKNDRFAAVRGFVQSAFPPLAGGDAAFGIEIEERIVPAIGREPIAKATASKLSCLND
jgi:hypothetical protein